MNRLVFKVFKDLFSMHLDVNVACLIFTWIVEVHFYTQPGTPKCVIEAPSLCVSLFGFILYLFQLFLLFICSEVTVFNCMNGTDSFKRKVIYPLPIPLQELLGRPLLLKISEKKVKEAGSEEVEEKVDDVQPEAGSEEVEVKVDDAQPEES